MPSGMPRFWPVGLLACLASSLLAFFGVTSLCEHGSTCFASGLLAFWHVLLMALMLFATLGLAALLQRSVSLLFRGARSRCPVLIVS